jgi:Holliday junction resolvasome RuvABC endonuclease subunit
MLGLDLSLTNTGYHLITGKGITSGSIPTERQGLGVTRLNYIWNQIAELIPSKGKTLVVMEDFAHARGFRAHDMGGLGWIVRRELTNRGIAWVKVGTGQLKKFVTGHGRAGKKTKDDGVNAKAVMVLHVFKRWNVEAKTDDEADACGLAHIGMCLAGLEQPETQPQREVLFELTQVPQKKKKRVKKPAA